MEDERAWAARCRLVARASSSCRVLREALLGPDAGELWQETWMTGPMRNPAYLHGPGLHEMLVRQAHLAQRAAVLITGFEDTVAAEAALASLTAAHRLELWGLRDERTADLMFAALPAQLRSLYYEGDFMARRPASLPLLQHLELRLVYLPEARLRCLAGWLPHLQSLRLVVRGYFSDSKVCPLRLLRLLPVDRLVLELWYRGAIATEALEYRLGQLAGVKLHTLDLQFPLPLSPLQRQLLIRCLVTDTVVLRVPVPAEQLQRLPSGAAVVLEPAPFDSGAQLDSESDGE